MWVVEEWSVRGVSAVVAVARSLSEVAGAVHRGLEAPLGTDAAVPAGTVARSERLVEPNARVVGFPVVDPFTTSTDDQDLLEACCVERVLGHERESAAREWLQTANTTSR